MLRAFVSYRHIEPDEALAMQLAEALTKAGVGIFIDRHIQVGVDWVAEIERQLRRADVFVVLLSEESILSDMVRQEIALAHELLRQGRMRIIPIRVNFDTELPYDLAASLSRIQYASWRTDHSVPVLCEAIVAAVLNDRVLPGVDSEDPTLRNLSGSRGGPRAAGAPLPVADPRLVLTMETGTIRLDSPFYVRRRADDEADPLVGESDMTLVVKGARQSGKSSLLARVHALGRSRGVRSVYVDLERLDSTQLGSLDSVFRWLARRIVRELDLRPSEHMWDPDLGPSEGFASFLENHVLREAGQRVQICLDEVDRVFSQPYRDDFFAAVRSWHNERATNERWRMLGIAIAHATEPSLWIQDITRSPFNVGERLRLVDFSTAQVADLNARHGEPFSDGEVEQFRELVDGHPYLVRQGLYCVRRRSWSLDQLQRVACDDGGPFGDHLRARLWLLHRDSRLTAVVRKVLNQNVCDDEMDFQRLIAAGLVRGEDRRQVRIRCPLYEQYFSIHL